MKKNSILVLLLILIFPIFVSAMEITENDAKIKYTIDESVWTREDSSDSNTKLWTSDCGAIEVNIEDIYTDKAKEDTGLSRELFNYRNIFYDSKMLGDFKNLTSVSSVLGEEAKVESFKLGYFHIINKGIDPLKGSYTNDIYYTLINGKLIGFSYSAFNDNKSSTCQESFEKTVKEAEATVKVKSKKNILTILLNLVLATVCFMAWPFIRVNFMGHVYNPINRRMSLVHSLVVMAIALGIQFSISGGRTPEIAMGLFIALAFHYINMFVWDGRVSFFKKDTKKVEKEHNDKKEEVKKVKFKCDNCGALVDEDAIKCPNCGESFEDEEEEKEEPKKEVKKAKFKCDNCGALVDEDATKCPNCGESFEDEEEVKEEPKKEVKKAQFKCDNCGALVDEDATKCPNCGESFEDEEEEEIIPEPVMVEELEEKKEEPKKEEKPKEEKPKKEEVKEEVKNEVSVDQKYSDLKKLKELLDNDIITKAEFDREKKKILK